MSYQAKAGPEALVVTIALDHDEAARFVAWMDNSSRRKADADAVVRKAVRSLLGLAVAGPGKKPRVRGSLLQGSVPEVWWKNLSALAEGRGCDASALIRDEIYSWINPSTGRLVPVKQKNAAPRIGARRFRLPADLRGLVAPFHTDYKRAGDADALVRRQVELTRAAGEVLLSRLRDARINKGTFLAALAKRICDKADGQPGAKPDAGGAIPI